MAWAKDITVQKRQWVLLTDPEDATITGVRLQLLGDAPCRIQATAGIDPTGLSVQGALILTKTGELILATDTLADLFPAVTSPLHLWAYAQRLTEISVNHA
jgi:hypothetical protein